MPVLATADAIGAVIWYSMLRVLPAEGGAGGRCRRRVAIASEMAASDGSGEGRWRQRCDGHELSSPIGGIGHSRGWQPGSKVSMMTIKAGVMEDGLVSPVDEGTPQVSPDSMSRSRLNPVEPPWYATRMSGGVGGVAPRGVPLSRSMRLIGRFGST